jgi:hypothetical protein
MVNQTFTKDPVSGKYIKQIWNVRTNQTDFWRFMYWIKFNETSGQ